MNQEMYADIDQWGSSESFLVFSSQDSQEHQRAINHGGYIDFNTEFPDLDEFLTMNEEQIPETEILSSGSPDYDLQSTVEVNNSWVDPISCMPPRDEFALPEILLTDDTIEAPLSVASTEAFTNPSSPSSPQVVDEAVFDEEDTTAMMIFNEIIQNQKGMQMVYDYNADDDEVGKLVDLLSENRSLNDDMFTSRELEALPVPTIAVALPAITNKRSADDMDSDYEPEPKSKRVAKKGRGRKPSNRKPEDKRERKRDQNKAAATRYRQKKKESQMNAEEGLEEVQANHAQLMDKVSKLQQEYDLLLPLALSFLKAKGQPMFAALLEHRLSSQLANVIQASSST